MARDLESRQVLGGPDAEVERGGECPVGGHGTVAEDRDDRLDIRSGNLLQEDFATVVGEAQRVLVIWDAHGYAMQWFRWIPADQFVVDVGFLVDPLTACLLIVVTTIGLLVHVYSIGYMSHDPGYWRFFAYLNLFMFSMLLLVLAGNFLVVFVAWELVGLSSYLLIGFWYRKRSAALAAKKAFIVNRVGDVGFILGIMLIFVSLGTLDIREVIARIGELDATTITLIALLVFAGAMGKSAQFPLHVWLPDAMEGPTPVSALIHAATTTSADGAWAKIGLVRATR